MATQLVEDLRIELLGPVRAWRGDEELDLGPGRCRAVFAMLAMRAGHTVSRQELIAGVWGDDPPASVEGNLYTYVSGLRRALDPTRTRWSGGDVLVSAGAGYCLRVAPGAIDVTAFDRLRTQSVADAEHGEFRAAAEGLTAALDLWHGDALCGISGPFAERHRVQLGELRLAVVERRAEATLALGGHHEIVAELAGLVAEHPLREGLRGLLMLALYRAGRTAEALASYRSAHQSLVDELGIEPGPALRRLHDRILTSDPTLDLPTPVRRPTAPRAVGGRLQPGQRRSRRRSTTSRPLAIDLGFPAALTG